MKLPGVGMHAVSDNGWIDQELFHYWMTDRFLTHAFASRPLRLLLDGHSSHFRLDTIQFAKDNDIVVFCLPPHTTHECQPLDCSFWTPEDTLEKCLPHFLLGESFCCNHQVQLLWTVQGSVATSNYSRNCHWWI